MADGQVKAIELQGIVRNRTKIGVEDGQAEDLINLRFVDGSWRTSGDGRHVYSMSSNASGYTYTQLYVHTNVYRHLLGVRDGKLWWFANIANDNVTFTPLGTPKEITTVHGDLWIVQTGHLITIIDGEDDFEHFLYKESQQGYIEAKLDVNGSPSSRKLYPFGRVNFNFYSPKPDMFFNRRTIDISRGADSRYFKDADFNTASHKYIALKEYPSGTTIDSGRDLCAAAYGELRSFNKFTGPRLACLAVRLYDGSFAYASNPVLVFPRQQTLDKKLYFTRNDDTYTTHAFTSAPNYESYASGYPRNGFTAETDGFFKELRYYWVDDSDLPDSYHIHYRYGITHYTISQTNTLGTDNIEYPDDILPPAFFIQQSGGDNQASFAVLGYDLVLSVDDVDFLRENRDIFQSICIFVTAEVADTEYKNKDFTFLTALLSPRDTDKITHDLLYSPFYLLKEYKVDELNLFTDRLIVDLSGTEDEGLLTNLVQNETLPIESTMRTTYLPKVSYMYNNRLHIANYKAHPFFGYPLEIFHLHNHSVKVQTGSWFKGVLENLADNRDSLLQYPFVNRNFPSSYPSGLEYFAYIKVTIETSEGNQEVVRYIEPYNVSPAVNGRADFIESLNPLISYPDARAKSVSMVIYKEEVVNAQQTLEIVHWKVFSLKPHPYLNLAYYIDDELKPIHFSTENSTGSLHLPQMQNAEEYFPNGLKVSKTDQPMYFPVENTYQVGSAEILAICSNAIAVGTGQTGAAPLYVFSKDGLYALFVDASGQMTYSNARVIARDVLNNPRSVTPIDTGVVFTTDRGLMIIAGEQVQEIGSPAEGDVLDYGRNTELTNPQHIKIAKGALTKIANLPTGLLSTVDFLTFIKSDAIITYNHNERELIISSTRKGSTSYYMPYSYVLDRHGNWSRRYYSADMFVNNYPTVYRVSNGEFYKMDEEGTEYTSLERKKESNNDFFYLSNIIKLDSIGFKEAHRFVVRGYFETMNTRYLSHGEVSKTQNNGATDIFDVLANTAEGICKLPGCRTPNNMMGKKIRITCSNNGSNAIKVGIGLKQGNMVYGLDLTSDYIAADDSETFDMQIPSSLGFYLTGIVAFVYSGSAEPIGAYDIEYTIEEVIDSPHIGCYVLGSYDGRKWAMLGGNEKTGKFTDIGCKIERTDVKFLRVCLAGQVTGKTRIDYMEISHSPSVLNTKIR